MTIVTKGMGAIIKKVADAFKSRGKEPSKLFKNPPYKASKEQIKKLFDLEKKGVVDRNISSKKIFKTIKNVKGKK
jgi:hypothetical protein|tara:strand:+ start:44 stop:268 length:225 start_codon:yes stop_codon:yes gene_type:complete